MDTSGTSRGVRARWWPWLAAAALVLSSACESPASADGTDPLAPGGKADDTAASDVFGTICSEGVGTARDCKVMLAYSPSYFSKVPRLSFKDWSDANARPFCSTVPGPEDYPEPPYGFNADLATRLVAVAALEYAHYGHVGTYLEAAGYGLPGEGNRWRERALDVAYAHFRDAIGLGAEGPAPTVEELGECADYQTGDECEQALLQEVEANGGIQLFSGEASDDVFFSGTTQMVWAELPQHNAVVISFRGTEPHWTDFLTDARLYQEQLFPEFDAEFAQSDEFKQLVVNGAAEGDEDVVDALDDLFGTEDPHGLSADQMVELGRHVHSEGEDAPKYLQDRAHKGFQKGIEEAWAFIGRKIAEAGSGAGNKRIFLTGHSLGAAIAASVAYRLIVEEPELAKSLEAVYAFGAPRLGNPGLAARMSYLSRTRGLPVYLVAHQRDLVVGIPPRRCRLFPDYEHAGQVIQLKDCPGDDCQRFDNPPALVEFDNDPDAQLNGCKELGKALLAAKDRLGDHEVVGDMDAFQGGYLARLMQLSTHDKSYSADTGDWFSCMD